jgi:nucleotide-binding universal stress UspA family protein
VFLQIVIAAGNFVNWIHTDSFIPANLNVKEGRMLPLQKILWPTDFSDASYKSLEIVKELAARFSAAVWAIHVVQPVSVFSAELTVTLPAYEKDLLEYSRAALDKAITARVCSEMQIHPVIRVGSPAHEIVRFAEEEKMEIIVIATHGESAFHHFIFGSVAEKVIRLALCPVLVIRVTQNK